MNRLDSYLLDDRAELAGPTVAIAAVVADAVPDGATGSDEDEDGTEPEVPINRRSRNRVVL